MIHTLCVSFSLSLSLTHTHTLTHSRTHSLFLSLSLSLVFLSLTHAHTSISRCTQRRSGKEGAHQASHSRYRIHTHTHTHAHTHTSILQCTKTRSRKDGAHHTSDSRYRIHTHTHSHTNTPAFRGARTREAERRAPATHPTADTEYTHAFDTRPWPAAHIEKPLFWNLKIQKEKKGMGGGGLERRKVRIFRRIMYTMAGLRGFAHGQMSFDKEPCQKKGVLSRETWLRMCRTCMFFKILKRSRMYMCIRE